MTAIHLNGQTWAICGGRDFSDQGMFDDAMSDLIQTFGCPSRIIHGDARGADQMAAKWGVRMAIGVVAVPADWATYGDSAGPRRNSLMLSTFKPSVVVAFPGNRGTADMVRKSRKADATVIEVKALPRSAPPEGAAA